MGKTSCEMENPLSERYQTSSNRHEKSAVKGDSAEALRDGTPGTFEKTKDSAAKITGEVKAATEKLVSAGKLPATQFDETAVLVDTLQNGHAAAWEKLKAVESLGRSGVKTVSLKDQNGAALNCEIQLEEVNGRTLVHLFSPEGRVILRGISNGDGTYARQQDKEGKAVSYVGTWWNKHKAGSSLGGVEDHKSA